MGYPISVPRDRPKGKGADEFCEIVRFSSRRRIPIPSFAKHHALSHAAGFFLRIAARSWPQLITDSTGTGCCSVVTAKWSGTQDDSAENANAPPLSVHWQFPFCFGNLCLPQFRVFFVKPILFSALLPRFVAGFVSLWDNELAVTFTAGHIVATSLVRKAPSGTMAG